MNDRDIRPVGPIRPIFLRSRMNDSLTLSDCATEKLRALYLALAILCFLVMAACVYLAQV